MTDWFSRKFYRQLDRESKVFLNNQCYNNCVSKHRKMNLDPFPTPCAKRNSKWIITLKEKAKIIKFLDDNPGKILYPWAKDC